MRAVSLLRGNIKALDNVKGICFLKENKPFRTSPREAIQDLDSCRFLLEIW